MSQQRVRDFEVFATIVQTGSFSAAARKLGCTPSAVSKMMERLESRIGARLFHRTSRALGLTQEGRDFRQAADQVLDALSAAECLFVDVATTASGTLRVHTTLAFAQHRLAPLVPDFLQSHPRIRLDFVLTSDPADMLADDIDLSIQVGPVADPNLIAKRIGTANRLVCASPAYLAHHGVPRSPEELSHHNCLNFFPANYHSIWSMRADDALFRPTISGNATSNSDNFLRVLACRGVGIARLADFHIDEDLREGRLVSLLDDFRQDTSEPIWAVFPSRRNMPARVRIFLKFIEARLEKTAGHEPSPKTR